MGLPGSSIPYCCTNPLPTNSCSRLVMFSRLTSASNWSRMSLAQHSGHLLNTRRTLRNSSSKFISIVAYVFLGVELLDK